MTYRQLVNKGKKESEDAERLLCALKCWDLTAYLLHREEDADDAFRKRYEEGLKRLKNHVPLQHITGLAPFYGRDFYVSDKVLVPRFDTEILVEKVLSELEKRPAETLLDLCTGSGCIALTIALEGFQGKITASDISCEALETAERNLEKTGASNVSFIESDMFENLPGRYDIIVSNPPYIRTGEIEGLSEEVRCHDPYIALDGGCDGLDFYRIIAREAKEHLTEGGRLFLEIGFDERKSVVCLLEREGYRDIRSFRDLDGKERVILCSTDLRI